MQEDRRPSRPPMSRGPRRPLEGIDRIIIDGTNVLHALERQADPPPAATLIGRLRSVIPAELKIVLVLDGPPSPGLATRRLASGLELRHAGRRTADMVILDLVTGKIAPTRGNDSPTPPTLVVSDDRELTYRARQLGATTIGSSWLIERLSGSRLASPGAGRPLPPPSAPGAGSGGPGGFEGSEGSTAEAPGHSGTATEREPWTPGRGATHKTGNGKRAPRQAR